MSTRICKCPRLCSEVHYLLEKLKWRMIDDLLLHQDKRRTDYTILWDGGRFSLHPALPELS